MKDRYPDRSTRVPAGGPTEAELEALVAEQMRNLPPWWEKETRRARKRRDD